MVVVSEGGWRDSNDLRLLDPVTGGTTKLTDSGLVVSPVWCHDGSIVYGIRRAGDGDTSVGPTELWRVTAHGGEPELLYSNDTSDYPSDCPASLRGIVFDRFTDSTVESWLAPLSGGAARRLRELPAGARGPRWSPNGRMVAYVDTETGEIGVVEASGRDPRLLTDLSGRKSRPTWSSDGSTVFFTNNAADWDIWYLPVPSGR